MPSGKRPCTFINTSHTLLLEKARRCIWPFNSDRPFVCLCRHSCDKPQTWCHCRSYGREIENFCQCCPFSLEPQAVSEGGVITDLSGWRFFCDFAFTYLYIHLHKTLKAIDRGYWKKSFQICTIVDGMVLNLLQAKLLLSFPWTPSVKPFFYDYSIF